MKPTKKKKKKKLIILAAPGRVRLLTKKKQRTQGNPRGEKKEKIKLRKTTIQNTGLHM